MTTRTRSHLEELFDAALVSVGFAWDERGYFHGNHRCVIPEFPMPPYRVDYLMVDCNRQATIIELDGHAYHERTPQQARHDRARDREMTSQNFRVLRFTAAEVIESAEACYYEAIQSMATGPDMSTVVDGIGLAWWVAAMRLVGAECCVTDSDFDEWSNR